MRKTIILLLALIAISAIAIFAWGHAPDVPLVTLKAKYANAESEFVDLGNGLTVHLRDEGPKNAPAIILLHGSNASLHTWEQWTQSLKGKYRIIRFDQIGHGLTGPNPDNDYSIAAFVDTVDRVAANRGLTRFTLGGNSMGGGVSWAYAKAHPEKLDGLILVDASGAPDAKPKSLPIGFRIMGMPGINQLATIITPRSVIATSLKQSVSNQAVVNAAEIDEYWELLRRPGNRDATLRRFAERARAVAAAGATAGQKEPTLSIPTLILWGEEDKLIPVSAAHWFATHLPASQTHIFKKIGHLPMEEVADESAKLVETWLDSTPRTEPSMPGAR
jgi:pimeloyl-ACP methyl ester carboxylesterase